MTPKLRYPDDLDLEKWRETGTFQSRRRVDLAELNGLVSSGHYEHCDHPYKWDVLFEVYRWALWNAKDTGPSEEGRWGTFSAFGQIGSESCVNVGAGRAFGRAWRADLLRRLGFVFNTDYPLVKAWREKAGVPRKIVLTGPFAKWGPIENELRMLFWCAHPSKRLAIAMNECHSDAREIQAIHLHPDRDGWLVTYNYGVDGSTWGLPPCEQRKGEPFTKFIRRAALQVEGLSTVCDSDCATAEPACSVLRWDPGTGKCGYSEAPPVEEDFALVTSEGHTEIVRAANAKKAWQKGGRILYNRGGNAWKPWKRGIMRDYESDDYETASKLFAGVG